MHETYKKWLDDNCPKVYCQCGCNEEIIIQKHHEYYGIPKYIRGHSSKGKNHPLFGKHHSKETIEKISGKNHHNFGKHHSKETIEKMSGENNPMFGKTGENHPMFGKTGENNPNFGKHRSKEMIEKISGENHHNWQGGKSFEPYCHKFNNQKKEEVRNEFDRKCYICGEDEKENITKNGKVYKLSIHHIDADKEQGCNGKPWKLVPVCLKCHSKIHNHKIIKE